MTAADNPTAAPKLPQMCGHRLAEDWQPSPSDRAFAESWGLSEAEVAQLTERFRGYWTERDGADAVKCDWAFVWRGWVNTAGQTKRVAALTAERDKLRGFCDRYIALYDDGHFLDGGLVDWKDDKHSLASDIKAALAADADADGEKGDE